MNLDLGDWVKEIEERGAGEICLNSIDTDGVRGGFDLDMLNFVCSRVKIPVIASGGCGSIDHFSEVFERQQALRRWRLRCSISESSPLTR